MYGIPTHYSSLNSRVSDPFPTVAGSRPQKPVTFLRECTRSYGKPPLRLRINTARYPASNR